MKYRGKVVFSCNQLIQPVLRRDKGATLVELAIVLSLLIAVAMPAFTVMVKKYYGDSMAQEIQAAFQALQQQAWDSTELDITAMQKSKMTCGLQSALQNVAGAVESAIGGSTRFCAVGLEYYYDLSKSSNIDSATTSYDSSGNSCTTAPPANLENRFITAAEPGAPLENSVFAIGVYSVTKPDQEQFLLLPFAGATFQRGSNASYDPCA
ncbi:MAG: hypothetical protein D6719_03155 [Candidatus Dadabacteria bacterium]|nr:MAG: hypothetical protein D6719_03155 [Candidatus Dadabacteria bacterium]